MRVLFLVFISILFYSESNGQKRIDLFLNETDSIWKKSTSVKNPFIESSDSIANLDFIISERQQENERTIGKKIDSLSSNLNEIAPLLQKDSLIRKRVPDKYLISTDPKFNDLHNGQNSLDIPSLEQKLKGYNKYNSKIVENPDQFIENKASQIDALKELNQQSSMAGDPMKNLPREKPSIRNITDPENLGSLDNQQAMEKMNKLFDVHIDKLKAAQSQMAKLKKKYSSVPNSSDLSTATKINSLKDEPLKKRLIVGSNFKFEGGNPIALDFSPLVMYKFNKAFHAGISGNYRASINYDEKSLNTNPQDVMGGSILARHFVISSFFAYTEFEYKSSTYSYDGKNWNSLPERKWVKGWLAGIGKEMTLYKNIKGTIILTYDFLYSEQSFTKSPWSIKLGFHVSDLSPKQKD